ncbi:MAG: radical SAM protein [Clostridia bacterium]|nr:radical SAM protein [Clostridia bacterium]MDD4376114.1 radical SAM protein [Clostridia bacterium]
MEKQKKKQNKKQQKKHLKVYKAKVNAKKELGIKKKKEKKYTIPIFIPHRGCNNNCVFCNQRRISGETKNVSIEDVKKKIDEYLSYYDLGAKPLVEVAFFGGSFTGLDIKEQQAYLEVVKPYIINKVISHIRISTRPDYIDDEILKLLKIYNVKVIELGVQSMDNTVLERSKRGHTKEDVVNSSILIKKHSFKLGHQIMVGLPGSSIETERESIRESIFLKPDYMRIYPVYVLKNSELWSMHEKGEYKELSLDEAVIRTKRIYQECIKNKVEVIRVGLQTTEEISENNKEIKGPVSDNYKERVLSSIMLDNIIKKLSKKKNIEKFNQIQILVPKQQMNYAVGNNRENINKLKEKYKEKISIKVIP